MLVFPERLLAGDLPNRDFLHLYGPGSLWVLAARLLGLRHVASRPSGRSGYLQQLGVVFGAWSLLRPWGPWVAATGGTIAADRHHPAQRARRRWPGSARVALGLWSIRAGVEALEEPEGEPAPHAGCCGRPGCSAAPRSCTASTSSSPWARPSASCCGTSPAATGAGSCSPPCSACRPTSSTSPLPGPGNVVRGHGDRARVRPAGRPGASRCRRTRTTSTASCSGPAPSTSRRGRSRRPPGPLQLGLWLLVLVVGGGLLARGRPPLRARRAGRACSSWPPSPSASSRRRSSGPTPPTWRG